MAPRWTESYSSTHYASVASSFSEAAIRHAFIQKVYGILSAQLIVTTVLGALVMHFMQTWKEHNPYLMLGLVVFSSVLSLAMMCLFICSPQLMRKSPHNYVILAIFTLAESFMVGTISSQFTTQSVLVVFGITAVVVIGLTLFSCQTSVDFTGLGPYLFCFAIVLGAFGMCLFFASMAGVAGSGAFSDMKLMYSAGAALLASMYIVFHTQLIIGGKHQYRFGIDDYAMAAIVLYLDIIHLFVHLLQILGDRRV